MIAEGITIQSVAEARADNPVAFAAIDAGKKQRERRAEWFREKMGKYGASNGGCLWTPTKTRLCTTLEQFDKCEADNATTRALIARKASELDGAATPEVSAKALAWGNDEEAPGIVDLMERTGLTVTHYGDDQKWFVWSASNQIGATPDGIVTGRVSGTTLSRIYADLAPHELDALLLRWADKASQIPVEQKNPLTPAEHSRMLAHVRTGSDLAKVEWKYWVQVQQQIMVLDAPFGIFFTRDKRRESDAARLGWWIVPRNELFITAHGARLLRAVQERDELFNAQQGREWLELGQIIEQ